jgi:xanthine dehydrogenase accessory factor
MEEIFNKILETLRGRKSCALATVVASVGSSPRKIGAKMLVWDDGSIEGTIGGGGLEKNVIADSREALRRKRSFLKVYPLDKKSGLQVCGGKVSLFIEICEPAKRLVIAGAGHIGLALSWVAKLLGFTVVIVDNRGAFANKKRFPHADRIIRGPYTKALERARIDEKTFVVIVTHGHAHDSECLEAALETPAVYIGMIGSQSKIKHVFGLLKKKGVSENELRRVTSPVGLKIGAQTPEEIAVSIAAQLVEVSKKLSLVQKGQDLPDST